jgi:hypothetical protein
MSMENKIAYFETRKDWRKWLSENFDGGNKSWFVS